MRRLSIVLWMVLAFSEAQAQEPNSMQMEEGHVTAADGVRLHYTRLGNAPQVIIVPNEIYMIDDFRSLASRHTVIFYDLRNRGRSDTVTERARLERGVHQDVDDLEAVRNHFELAHMSVLAHSYPSILGAMYAMKYPARLQRIVQIGPPPPDPQQQLPANLQYADATSADVFAKLGRLRQQSSAMDEIESCRRSWEILRPLYVGKPENAIQLSHWGFCELRNERQMLTHFNQNILPTLQTLAFTASDYAQVTMPVLIIHGTHDRNAPYGGGREWARSLPNARLLTIEGAAHVPHIEERERVLGAIDAFFEGAWPSEAIAVE